MNKLFLAAFLAIAPTSCAFAEGAFAPLVTPAELSAGEAAADPLILDIRGPAYAEGHIPGAVSAPYGEFRGPADNPGQLVPVDVLQNRLRGWGVSTARPVVIVYQGKDSGDFGAAARVYWTLKSAGVKDLSILNGGMNAWLASGLPVDKTPVTPAPSDIEVHFSHEWLATTEDVAAVVAGKDKAALVDARPPAFFEGEKAHPAASRPGTLPAAENLPNSEFFVAGAPAIGGEENAKEVIAKLGLTPGEKVVSFCNTGHWAATDWFAMSEIAHIPDVKLYPDSMVGYSKTDLPMEHVPGLLSNLKRQIGLN